MGLRLFAGKKQAVLNLKMSTRWAERNHDSPTTYMAMSVDSDSEDTELAEAACKFMFLVEMVSDI